MARDGSADELADSLFADLFATAGGNSLLAYYHGRARLGSWLRTVLAQRYVDRYRAARRTVALDDDTVRPRAVESPTLDPHHGNYVRLVQRALDDAIGELAAEDRLRLRLYYGGSMTLAQIGRLVGEHEATVSRKLERARRALRTSVEARLRDQGLAPEAIEAAIDAAGSASSLDASRLLAEEPE
jgi:RNA polymerase sigma factor (sigma-70 family)